MTLGEKLTELRSHFPECNIVAYADLSTGMILSASTRNKMTQERLDALCSEAMEQLAHPRVHDLLGHDQTVQQVFRSGQKGLRVFIRSRQVPEDVLCLDYDSMPRGEFIDRALGVLDDIASEV